MITSEDISRPPPGAVVPLSVRFSPDGRYITYLFPDANGLRQVYAVDCSGDDAHSAFKLVELSSVLQSQKALSLQEQLRRERMRLFTTGVSTYEWGGSGPSDQVMLIPVGGEVLLFDPRRKTEQPLSIVYDGAAGASVDPHLSPDCTSVAFVINDDLYVQHFSPLAPSATLAADGTCLADVSLPLLRLTHNGEKPGITCGLADFIAQEEMDRYRGFWWSPDSKLLAYTETDENNIPEYQILHQGKANPRHIETHRYPFAGQPNPRVRLAVATIPTSVSSFPTESVWMDLAGPDSIIDPDDHYLARAGWWPDNSVMAQVQNRRQTLLQLLRLDPSTGRRIVLVEETTVVWTNLHDMCHTFSLSFVPSGSSEAGVRAGGDSFYFIWASERSGFCHLYLYRYDGPTQTCTALLGGQPIGGGGDWVVESIDAVDEAAELVYFSCNRGAATERHLCVASFASKFYCSGDGVTGSGLAAAVTLDSGWHVCAVRSVCGEGVVANVFSSRLLQPRMNLYALSNSALAPKPLCEILNPSASSPGSPTTSSDALAALAVLLQPPEIVAITSTDSAVTLHCAIYRPPTALHGPGPYPAIVSVYGGPHVQRVMNHWSLTADMRAQRLAQDGCVVIKCDNRGTSRRGLSFEGAIKGDMGRLEVEDQKAAVSYLVELGLADPGRVGMFGWSYGGYMSAMSLCRAPETFCCSVAGAPVTSWDGYDTHYTERYMGLPQDNPQGYESSSVMTHVAGMQGRLLLVHGLIDENVHFRHTARLINKLIEHRKPYDLILFPCERHSPHSAADRVYMEDRIMAFFSAAFASSGAVTGAGTAEMRGGITPLRQEQQQHQPFAATPSKL